MRRTGSSEENKRIIMDLETVLKSHSCPYIVHCYGIFITEVRLPRLSSSHTVTSLPLGHCSHVKHMLLHVATVMPLSLRHCRMHSFQSEVWICMELMATCLDKLVKKLKCAIPENILGKITVSVRRSESLISYIARPT